MSVKINARFVKLVLADRDMTLRDLAKISGIHEQTLYRLMGGATFNSDTLAKLANALECNPADLIESKGYPPPHVEAPLASVA